MVFLHFVAGTIPCDGGPSWAALALSNPKGCSASGGPERRAFLERSVREEWAKGPGEKSQKRWFRKGTAAPIGQRQKQGIVAGDEMEKPCAGVKCDQARQRR